MPDVLTRLRDAYQQNPAATLSLLPELFRAADEGKIVELPCIPIGKTLYWIWGDEIMPVKYKGISHGCVDKKKYHIVCEMATKKNRTFIHGKREFTYEKGNQRFFYDSDIGHTVFLTREAAEAALKERGQNA